MRSSRFLAVMVAVAVVAGAAACSKKAAEPAVRSSYPKALAAAEPLRFGG